MSIPSELKPGLYAWAVAIVAPWVRAPAFGAPYGWFEVLVCLLLIGGFLVPAAIKQPIPLEHMHRRIKPWVILALLVMALIACLSLFQATGGNVSGTLNERRLDHQSGESTIGAEESRLFSLFSPALTILLVESAFRAKKMRWALFALALLGGVLLLAVVTFGGRYDGLCCGCCALVAGLMRYEREIKSVPRSVLISISLLLFIGLAIANSIFGALRQREGFDDKVTDMYYSRGAEMMSPFGVSRPAFSLGLTVGMVDEYLFRTVCYFGYYLHDDKLRPALGQHSFAVVTRRFGFNQGIEYKRAVDDGYAKYGIDGNVWATAFREFCIDFKLVGTLILSCAFGWLFGMSRTRLTYSWFAHFVAAIIAAMFLLSPFTSIFKSVYFQTGFVVGLVLLAVDLCSGYMLTELICMPMEEIDGEHVDEDFDDGETEDATSIALPNR